MDNSGQYKNIPKTPKPVNMRLFKTFSFVVCILFSILLKSCYINGSFESIRGNGQVVTEERTVPDFTGIRVSSGIDVYISQGGDMGLEVEADENLHEVIETTVFNGILKIQSRKNIRSARSKKVYVGVGKLNSIGISSAGDVYGMDLIKTDKLDISVSSAGDLELKVEADEIDVDISSSGDVELMGKCNSLIAHLSSAGDLDAYDLQTKYCRVRVSSAGNASVFATEELDMRASSSGDIYYRGDAKIIHSSTSSSGGIHRR